MLLTVLSPDILAPWQRGTSPMPEAVWTTLWFLPLGVVLVFAVLNAQRVPSKDRFLEAAELAAQGDPPLLGTMPRSNEDANIRPGQPPDSNLPPRDDEHIRE